LWQQNSGEDPVILGKIYHSNEFIDKCESLGVHPILIKGCRVAVAAEVFAQLMGKLGTQCLAMPPIEEIRIDWFRFLEDWLGKEAKG